MKISAALLYLSILLLHHILVLQPKIAGLAALEQEDTKALVCQAAQVTAESPHSISEYSQFALRSQNKQTNQTHRLLQCFQGAPTKKDV